MTPKPLPLPLIAEFCNDICCHDQICSKHHEDCRFWNREQEWRDAVAYLKKITLDAGADVIFFINEAFREEK